MKIISSLFLTLVLMSSCQSKKDATSDAIFSSVTLARTPCFGTCPIYEITFNATGKASLNAEAHLKNNLTGKFEGQLSKDNLSKISDELNKINITSLEDKYGSRQVTDLPSVNTTVVLSDGTEKKIDDYGGNAAPLKEFYLMVDALVYETKWEKK